MTLTLSATDARICEAFCEHRNHRAKQGSRSVGLTAP